MAKYAIEDTTLTALGDAVRNKTEQTRKEIQKNEIVLEKKISKTPHAISFTEYDWTTGYGNNTKLYDVINIPGATSLKVDFAVQTESTMYDWLQIASGELDETTFPTNATKYGNSQLQREEVIFENTDTITFYFRSDGSTDNFLGYYAEIIPLGALGEDLTKEETEITVKNTMTPMQMVEKINEIINLPEEAFTITGTCANKFSYGGWNWYVDLFGNKITTKSITDMHNMCYHCNIKNIPFDFNIISPFTSMTYALSFIQSTGQPPLIKGELNPPTSNYSGTIAMDSLFYNSKFSSIPYDYFHNFGGEAFWETSKTYTNGARNNIFYGCVNLRNLPDISMLLNASTSSYNNFYYGTFNSCHALDEAVNIPVANHCTYTSNMFGGIADTTTRLKRFTFAVQDDGTPYVCNWKNQTINLNTQVGYNPYSYGKYELFPQGKEVTDEATYNALKDDPDWHTKNINYARYNHDSAVETINSLPDCSSSGGVNTIKFMGAAGALTDGGAINTLTAEEIAVAAAKGWTVSLV